jgi:hypothetical protein
MKPLSEWTVEELWDRITDLDHRREYMSELLRRERVRCARACGDVAVYLRANGMAESVHVTEACAAAIQELQ